MTTSDCHNFQPFFVLSDTVGNASLVGNEGYLMYMYTDQSDFSKVLLRLNLFATMVGNSRLANVRVYRSESDLSKVLLRLNFFVCARE